MIFVERLTLVFAWLKRADPRPLGVTAGEFEYLHAEAGESVARAWTSADTSHPADKHTTESARCLLQ
jgi:hypothetical protein